MILRTWLRFVRLIASRPPAIRQGRSTRPNPRRRTPVLETLEDRLAPATLTVNSLADTVTGSATLDLREAILLVNSGGTATDPSNNSLSADKSSQIAGMFGVNDTINFHLASSGAQTIFLNSQLPPINQPIVIDGTTEADWIPNTSTTTDNANLTVVLDGSGAGASEALVVAGGNSTVKGLQIQNFMSGIHLMTNGSNSILGNRIDNAGNGYASPADVGFCAGGEVYIDDCADNTIGGTTLAARNQFTNYALTDYANGGLGLGIQIAGTQAQNNQVLGNLIGTDGNQALPTGIYDILIWNASSNTIGPSNVIAGATGQGNIEIVGYGAVASGNTIQGNFIGTNAAGTKTINDQNTGIGLDGDVIDTTIGGTSAGDRNVISPMTNGGIGVGVQYPIEPVTTGTAIEGNYIGINATGTTALDTSPAGLLGIFDVGDARIVDNVISGCGYGIAAQTSANTSTMPSGQLTIQGNLIGTDSTGLHPVPNDFGMEITLNDAQIGGTQSGQGNTIAFNDGAGVVVSGTGVTIDGNFIYGNAGPGVSVAATGVDIEGNSIYGNAGPGIDNVDGIRGVVDAQTGSTLPYTPFTDTNWPGGPSTGTNNATFSGLTLTQTGSTLTYTGTLINALPNTRYVVELDANTGDPALINALPTYWGSDFVYYTTDGSGQAAIDTSFQAPSGYPFNPGPLSQPASATANPPHSLGNHEQNYPVLTAVSSGSSSTSISGSLNSAANTQYTIDFYANSAPDPSGYGQGQYYLGHTTVTTDANGNVTFSANLPTGNLADQWITATATDPSGNTSEFDADVQATTDTNTTFAQDLQGFLPQSNSTANSMTILASANVPPATVIPAVNALANVSQPVTIVLDLGGSTYTGGVAADPPANVSLVVQNGTLTKSGTTPALPVTGGMVTMINLNLDPNVPAVTVTAGQVAVLDCTLTTSGNAPTILVTGGSLTLRNDMVVQASPTSTAAAVSVTGGTVDLGTAASPGGNTLNVSGTGQLVQNTTAGSVSAVGDTFEVNGTALTASSLSFTTLTSSGTSSLTGQSVTFTATVRANVSGSGTPTGSVDFLDVTTGADLGSHPLSGGTATLSISTLAVGGHTIRARYSGDNTFTLSQDSLTQTVIPPASLSGLVFEDFNDDGQVDFGEQGIAGVTITLTGTDDLGHSVNLSQQTDSAGTFLFLNLRPGNYYLTETQPAGYGQGIDSVGMAGGSLLAQDEFFVQLGQGVNGFNYNYAELPPAGGAIQKGQTAGIGFWNNKNGQALINALNGSSNSTELGNWLAATLPNLFGPTAGASDLAGKNNATVAALFQSDFLLKGVKLDAQVLATALSVYVTNATLDSTGVGAQYGFTVSGDGVGTATVNVGSNGDAFGVANNTTMTVMDLLLATDAQAVNGLLYNGNTTKRNEANNVYSAVNETGSIN
jgi:hypothetical protein